MAEMKTPSSLGRYICIPAAVKCQCQYVLLYTWACWAYIYRRLEIDENQTGGFTAHAILASAVLPRHARARIYVLARW